MWSPDAGPEGDQLARLQRFLRELGESAGAAASPLFVAADRSCGWGWLPYRAAAADSPAKVRQFTLARPDSPSIAIGTMTNGVEGFRQSHREAETARSVAVVAKRPAPTVISATDPGLSIVARLGGDVAGTPGWVVPGRGYLAAHN